MGLTSALGIGRTALMAYQSALELAGQNIANVGTPGYTRVSGDFSALPGKRITAGQLGAGVRLGSIRRNISEPLQMRLRRAISDQQSASTERAQLARLEDMFDPFGNSNLATMMSEFFAGLNELQNTPDNLATRGIVINTGAALAERIQDVRQSLMDFRTELNSEIETAVLRADELASDIADLNRRITIAEAGTTGPASPLRDQRDQALAELASIFEITTKEQPNGAVNVFIGSEALIQFGDSFGLHAETELDPVTNLLNVVPRFTINNGPVDASSGAVAGLITSRDVHNQSQFARLDALAGALIYEINKVHSGGQGLVGFATLTGETEIIDSTLALNTAGNGIAFLPQTGSFFIDVTDSATGSVIRTQVNINLDGIGADTTLDSLAADITANVADVTATVLSNGRLELTAATGKTFTFNDDTSGALAALGINTFFTGESSLDIEVNPLIVATPTLVAAANSNLAGDGSNATVLAGVQELPVALLGGISLNEYYNTSMANIAVSASAASSASEAADVIFDSLSVQRESISGVNLDEEAVNLIAYERAYQGTARYMLVVDEMLQTLLSLVR